MDRNRLFHITFTVGGNLAAAAAQATHSILSRCRILKAEAALNTTGGTSGNTDVDVNKNGTSIMAAQALRIAQGSATKFVQAAPSVGVVGEPAGVPCEPGDTITVDVDAVPGTTSKDLTVRLLCMAVDV